MSVPLGVVVSIDCAVARLALLEHDVENISDLMMTLNAQASHMFQRAVQLPGLGAQQKFMLSKVLEARLVQRQIWKAAKAAAPWMKTQSLVRSTLSCSSSSRLTSFLRMGSQLLSRTPNAWWEVPLG
jgi:hypothetical protein